MTHPTGVFAAALTPLAADLSPDHAAFIAHCRYLLAEGCDGVAMLGTTGEANSFSARERQALLEAVVAAGIAPDRLLPGTGVAAFSETVELTKHALSVGVTTVVMLPPFYYKGVTDDGVFAAYSEVVQRVADARLRVVLYHIPQFSAVPISHDVIDRLLAAYPTIFTGIKDSAGDIANMTAMVERFPGFAVLAGADPLLLPLLRAGGAGCITATGNVNPGAINKLYQTWKADAAAADAQQAALDRTRAVFQSVPIIPGMKRTLADHSGDAAWATVRPPLVELDDTQAAKLSAALAQDGFTVPDAKRLAHA
jgi:4-hydroxy-tetrahydrodipicolinate synthase